MAAWYQKNKARLSVERKQYLADYYQANKDRVAESGRAYREANRERLSETRKAYRESDRGRETSSAWRNANADRLKELKAKSRHNEDQNKRRDRDFKQKYGITLADYEYMFEQQGGLCAICLGPPKSGRRMAVDHDHDTGAIRGLLCNTCNLAIGHLRDDPAVVASAFAYLEANHA